MSDQLQPEDTLDDRGVKDVLDEGYSPPDREPHDLTDPVTHGGHSTMDEHLSAEEPEVWAALDRESSDSEESDLDGDDVEQVGDQRSGRLADVMDGDIGTDSWARDVGIDGAGASAEEAAMHTIGDDTDFD